MKFRVYQATIDYYWTAVFDAWPSDLRLQMRARKVEVRAWKAEVRDWCTHTFGRAGISDNGTVRWKDDIIWGAVSFRDEKDLAWFLLRWA